MATEKESNNELDKGERADTSACQGWTVGYLLGDMGARRDEPAVISVGGGELETWSYRMVSDAGLALIAGLREAGVKSGDAVAIWAANRPEWIVVALAVTAFGCLLVPIDDLSSDEEATSILEASATRWIFSSGSHLDCLRPIAESKRAEVYLLDRLGDGEPEWKSWQELSRHGETFLPEPRPDDPACLFHTSGTTGPAKSFSLSHANIGTNVQALVAERLVTPGDRALLPLPLHHAYPFVVGMLTSLQSGIAIVLPESVTGPHLIQALQAARVTTIIGVPRLYEALLRGLEAGLASRGDLVRLLFSSLLNLSIGLKRRWGIRIGAWLLYPLRRRLGPDLRLLVSGGAKLEAELAWKLEGLGWEVLTGYGLAETASVFTANLPRKKHLGSGGILLGDGEVRISHPDATGVGEIELRGSSITREYRDNPEATQAAFAEGGWFRTGDLGFLDADGFLFITGRRKEAIVLGGGKKVNPEDLEKVYAAKPIIAEIAVLESGGQLVGLLRPSPEELSKIGTLNVEQAVRVALSEAAQTLPPHERLAGFAVTNRPLPRTRLGKYRRFLLPALYEEGQRGERRVQPTELSDEDKAFLANPVAAQGWRLMSERYADRDVGLDSHLSLDLGIDSLGWLALSLELEEKSGVTIAETDLAEIETVRDLLSALVRASAAPAATSRTRRQRLLAERERWLSPTGFGSNAMRIGLMALNKMIMRVVFRLQVKGREGLPQEGAFVLVPNHVSDLDPPVIAAALPFDILERTYWAGDVVRLFGDALRRQFCRAVHLYPVDERDPSSAIEMASSVLAQGKVQVWFAEGWRSPDGRLQRFLPGVGELLLKSSAPAVPAYIAGAFQAMPRTRRWPRPYPIRVIIGKPLDARAIEQSGEGETAEERIANALRAEVARLAASIGDSV